MRWNEMIRDATLSLTSASVNANFFGMPKIEADAKKGTIRTYVEVAKLAQQTEDETNVDAHAVMLLVMRFYRQLPPKLRLAVVTQDPGTFSVLLRESVLEMADEATPAGQPLASLAGTEAPKRKLRGGEHGTPGPLVRPLVDPTATEKSR